MFSNLRIHIKLYSEYLSTKDRNDIERILKKTRDEDLINLNWLGINIGEHAMSGTLRFYARGTLNKEPHGNKVLRQYIKAAMLSVSALNNIFKEEIYEAVIFHHGIYVPQGLIGEVCRQKNIRVINWHPAYRSQCYLFSHQDTYHRTMISESPQSWSDLNMTDKNEQTLMNYLTSRSQGKSDWISFQSKNKTNVFSLKNLGLDPKRPIIGLLTNVIWDAQLHFKKNAFNSMQDWLSFTIEYFSTRSDIQLLIRIHPAEVKGSVVSRDSSQEEIKKRFPRLPKNISIIEAWDPLDTYALMKQCNTVLVYGTKMATELPCWGIPVIVAGEAWARGKGFTYDVSSITEYKHALAQLPTKSKMSQAATKKARRYAYHFFFRRMIPIRFSKPNKYLVPFRYEIDSLETVAPGSDKGLDTICNGIIYGTPFIYKTDIN